MIVILAFFVGIIIIGGTKRIASVTEKIVLFIALLYILACIYILIGELSNVILVCPLRTVLI